jgi:adenine-specific DNA-methyltransferase
MEGTSMTPQQEKLKALQELLPEAFAEGKIDWEKLKATLGEDINFSNERYVLNWAGKSDAFKVLQTPTTKTLVPAKDESINFDETENIFIEGENLEVLKVLQKSYFGKVKMIYIDPPYNTGNDSFIYPDNFSETKAEYEKRVGDKDEDGYMTKDGMFKKNSKENGQYHSNWLNMMMPRLYLAKNLLTQDGVIFVSIDDNEVHNLRLLMNEIFGEENFEQMIWRKSGIGRDGKMKNTTTFRNDHEYIMVAYKSLKFLNKSFEKPNWENSYGNPDNDPRGNYKAGSISRKDEASNKEHKNYYTVTAPSGREITRQFEISKEDFEKLNNDNRIYWGANGDAVPAQKIFEDEKREVTTSSLIDDRICTTTIGSKEIEELFNLEGLGQEMRPKPINLLKKILKIGSSQNDLIIDFFAGSGTTAQAIMELNKEEVGSNRRFISVQMPELCDEKNEAYKAGYKTIAEISKERIRRASKKIQLEIEAEKEKLKIQIEFEAPKENNIDLGFKVLKLADSNFKQWQQIEGKDAKALTEQMQLFIDPVSENATIENMVYEFLLKSGKDLNSKIEKRNDYFVINNNELILLLESVSQTIIEQVIAEKPMKVIALDKLFTDNDQLKTNTVLQMRDAGIEFKTI